MALRDIIARFGVQIDGEEKLAKINKELDKSKGSFTEMAAAAWLAVEGAEALAAALGGLAGFTMKTTNAASHAEEVLAGLKQTFEENSAAILAWTVDTSKALGRSEYALQEYALQFGAVLQPLFRGSDKDITHMTKTLTQLTLDLASFYDTTEEEAQMRIFSGLNGETESVRRYGIDISDTTLHAFNKQQGDDRSMQALTRAEKAYLIYQKILIDTEKKQGDVVRSQGRWADSVKRLSALWAKLEIVLGQKIMPVMMSIAEYGTQFLLDVIQLVEKSSFLEGAWVTIGVLLAEGAAAAAGMLVSFFGIEAVLGTMAAAAGSIIAITMAFLVIEDIVTFLRGGKSVFGDWLKDVTGLEEPLTAVAALFKGIWIDVKNIGIAIYDFTRIVAGLVMGIAAIPVAVALALNDVKNIAMGEKTTGKEHMAAYRETMKGMFDPTAMDNSQQGFAGAWFEQTFQGTSSRAVANTREDGWTEAIKNDDLVGAVKGFKMEHESESSAWDRANRERAALVTTGAVAPTDWDIQRGFIDPSGASGVLYNAPSNYSGGRGDANMSVSVSVETGADAQSIGNVVAEKVREELRNYSHASQEESYDDGYSSGYSE